MRNPIDVLNSLSDKAKDPTYRYERLYRNLYNPEFYLLAYKNVYANDGSMTPGMDGNTIDGMSSRRIEGIIATVYKGNIIKNLIMDCQSYTKYRPNETTGGIFVSWRRKEELPTGA